MILKSNPHAIRASKKIFGNFKKILDKSEMRCYNCYINLIKGYDEDGVECKFYRELGRVKANKQTSIILSLPSRSFESESK